MQPQSIESTHPIALGTAANVGIRYGVSRSRAFLLFNLMGVGSCMGQPSLRSSTGWVSRGRAIFRAYCVWWPNENAE